MGNSRNGRNVFDDAEEVGALHEDGGCLIGDSSVKSGQIDASGFAVIITRVSGALMPGVSRKHLAVLGWTVAATTALCRR